MHRSAVSDRLPVALVGEYASAEVAALGREGYSSLEGQSMAGLGDSSIVLKLTRNTKRK